MNPTRARVLLGSILILAAALRFTGLGWGLRHRPDLDERWFVESVGRMLAARDLDHRFYEYPGLFIYFLAPVLAFFRPPDFGAGAYLAARVVVALFGVTSVGLTYLLAARLAGRGAGLAAALFVAVSPVEVFTAHMVRPDVALEAFVLLAFLAFLRLGSDWREDLLSGIALGVATAVKFTGVLLAPSYVAQRLGAPGFRVSRLALAAGASLVAFALCSPFTFLHFGVAVRGAHIQVFHHYEVRGRGPEHYLDMAWTYGLGLMKSFGPLGLALVAAGVLLAARDGRREHGPRRPGREGRRRRHQRHGDHDRRPVHEHGLEAGLRREAREARLEMEDWADSMLASLEVNLDRFLTAVRRGRERLHERSQETVVGAGVGPSGDGIGDDLSY